MMSPRCCLRRKLIRLGAAGTAIATVPTLFWAAVLLVAPTGWARQRVERELAEATGRAVAIESITLGPLGTLRVRGLSMAEPASPDDPWLKVAEARLDVHLLGLVVGRCEPGEIDLSGVDLRVHRRADGSLEFADLLTRPPRPEPRGPRGESARRAATIRVEGSRVVVVDDLGGAGVELTDLEGSATWDGRVGEVPLLRGRLNGGSFAMAASYDRSGPEPAIRAELRARGLALGAGGLRPLGLLAPVLAAEADGAIDGRCDVILAIEDHGATAEALGRNLVGHGQIKIDPIDLSGSRLYAAFKSAGRARHLARIGSVESHFAIKDRRVVTDDLTVTIARLPNVLAGWTDFDGRIEYAFRPEASDARLPAEARRFLGELRRDLGELAHLRITGTIDAPEVLAGPIEVLGGPRRVLKDADKARLEEAARVLREKYLR